MSMDDINNCLDKIYALNKYLGGTAWEADFRSKNASVFKSLNADFFRRFEQLKKTQNTRNDRLKEGNTGIEVLRANNKVKLDIEALEAIIQKMHDNLEALRKAGRQADEGEEAIYNCQKLLEKVKEVEYHYYRYERKNEENKDQRVLRARGFRRKLVDFEVEEDMFSDDEGAGPEKKKPKREGEKIDKKAMNANLERLRNEPLNDEEKLALENWKKQDRQVDEELDQIEQQMDGILGELDNFRDNMKKNEVLVEYISEEVFKLATELETTNAKMKIIIEKFKGPGRLCIDICMSLTLAVLIGLLVYLVRRYISISGGSG